MCGILCRHVRHPGALASPGAAAAEPLTALLAGLRHRGPDAISARVHGQAWLGHTRLAVIDLRTGDQPQFNEDGTVAVVLNGEIYNHGELRRRLQACGHVFRSESDTEVIAHLYEEYGEDLCGHLLGMFAFVISDSRTGALLAARDRLGQKPLLYHQDGDALHLASELKALAPLLGSRRRVDRQALALFLNAMYVPAPLTIWEGVRKLPPAHLLRHDAEGLVIRPYWQPRLQIDWSLTEADAVGGLRERLEESVASQLVADVPLGVFLSGGLDSAAVTVCAARSRYAPVDTFTFGLDGGLDERPWARAVAERCGSRHRELRAGLGLPEAFLRLLTHFDEPFADNSALPTYLLAHAAREHVTVVLTGDGGDELLAGYDGYLGQQLQRETRTASRTESLLARYGVGFPYPRSLLGNWPQRYWQQLRSAVPAPLVAAWLGGPAPGLDEFWQQHAWLPLADTDPLSRAFAHDLNFYLPDDLLKKVDMACMFVGLESRSPFLDHRLVEFCLTIPPPLKLAGGRTKHLLREVMAPHLPAAVLERPKQGFGSPVRDWVRGPLREIARDLLRPGCRCEAWLDPEAVTDLGERFWSDADPDDWRLPLQYWTLLSLEGWLRHYE